MDKLSEKIEFACKKIFCSSIFQKFVIINISLIFSHSNFCPFDVLSILPFFFTFDLKVEP